MDFSVLSGDFLGSTNRLYQRLGDLRREGSKVIDLIGGNVTEHGLRFPSDLLHEVMERARAAAEVYAPDARGQSCAREALASYAGVDPQNILLTPGTSVSYWYAFKLLCNPGEEILCPTPAYPLFEYIARLAGVSVGSYRLDEAQSWGIDFDSLEESLTNQSRAIVLISPHNPTGMVADPAQLEQLSSIAARNDIAIIADEVFREFVYEGAAAARPSESGGPLVLTLNGLSKMFALPGMKIGWMAVSGNAALVEQSIRTLEFISDTFLPVNEIAQFAVPGILEHGRSFLNEYRKAMASRRETALQALGTAAGLPPMGGFHMVVPFERDIDDEALAIEVLESEGTLIHPGYFYDIPGSHVVLSFIHEEDVLREAVSRIVRHLR